MSKETKARKEEHIRICLEKDVQYKKSNGFEHFELEHKALPEISRDEIDLKTKFLGKKFNYPLFIEAMTGGTKLSEKINKNLAKAAESLGIGMGLGSQRAMLEDPETERTYHVRDVAPNIFLLGNIGVAQLPEYSLDQINSLVEKIEGNGLAVHFNVAQELAQKEGDREWKDMFKWIKNLCLFSEFPVIAKETGCGISGELARELERVGVKAIDIAGAGGTSWIKVDRLRSGKPMEHLDEWGIPTAFALKDVVEHVEIPVIASGGIRNGVEIAKALCMGASLAGMAYPLLEPATQSWVEVKKKLELVVSQLKDAMFLIGARNPKDLREIKITEI